MPLSNRFPEMTDDEAAAFVRHGGSYTVALYRPDGGGWACAYRSAAFALDTAGHEDTAAARDAIAAGVAYHGRHELAAADGSTVVILPL